jgi:hypothetical protein
LKFRNFGDHGRGEVSAMRSFAGLQRPGSAHGRYRRFLFLFHLPQGPSICRASGRARTACGQSQPQMITPYAPTGRSRFAIEESRLARQSVALPPSLDSLLSKDGRSFDSNHLSRRADVTLDSRCLMGCPGFIFLDLHTNHAGTLS